MLRRVDATPCPQGPQADHQRPRDLIISLGGDDTEDIDFTTEFRASLRAIKPQRRQTAVGSKRRGMQADFVIHEDHESYPSVGSTLKGSILAKPPQRPKQRVAFLPDSKGPGIDPRWQVPDARRNGTGPASTSNVSTVGAIDLNGTSRPVKREEITRRPARRGTVYIPPDDTTMPSMHMGIFSPIKELQTARGAGEQDETLEFTGLAAKMARKRGRRESLVTAPAKRVPLQQPTQVKQEPANLRSIPGKRTGKENVPPGQLSTLDEAEYDETKLFDLSRPEANKRRTSVVPPIKPLKIDSHCEGRKMLCAEGSSTKANAQSQKPPSPPRVATTHIEEIKRYQSRPSSQNVSHRASRPSSLRTFAPVSKISSRPKENNVPAQLSVPEIPQVPLQQQYPLLSENISDPSLYEDSWLTYQEIAITQLINTLFQTSQGARLPPDIQQIRHELLEKHQHPSFSLLHRRLQASLLYGALSIPKDILARGSRLWTDLGRRERFCSFWLDTYDLSYLAAALEVVVGRQCSTSPRTSQDGQSSTLKSRGSLPAEARNFQTGRTSIAPRRNLRAFLETFLIRNEDSSPETASPGPEAWSYQRTMLRSLMLIKLLDRSKAVTGSSSSTPLFLPTSPYKSSAAVVKALVQMLNPGIGDVLRVLSYLDYTLDCKQYPLEEYNYHIGNLAVDLRDGVILTRLVELLLYPGASQSLAREHNTGATTTVVMPGGETLCLSEGEYDWPLSQHLKFPSLGRATKLYNVQLALSALTGVRGMESLVRDIGAEDIVDGFREKTVALLWGLTGKWGLGGLLDWEEIRRETRRLSKTCHLEYGEWFDDFGEGFEGHKMRLKAWASAVASGHGLQVRNLSTSFSDGKVFQAIVDEYSPYLNNTPGDKSHDLLLHEKLGKLGCSSQFVKLFAPVAGMPSERFFDKDFVVAALAFLCSRLLSATKTARAAVKIQRTWRQFRNRLHNQRQRVAKQVAEQCMVVVQTRERLLWAKTVIWRFWRAHRESSIVYCLNA